MVQVSLLVLKAKRLTIMTINNRTFIAITCTHTSGTRQHPSNRLYASLLHCSMTLSPVQIGAMYVFLKEFPSPLVPCTIPLRIMVATHILGTCSSPHVLYAWLCQITCSRVFGAVLHSVAAGIILSLVHKIKESCAKVPCNFVVSFLFDSILLG